MTDPCGSVTELHSLPKRHFHQGMKKKIDLGRWISGGLHMAKTE